MEKRFIHVKGTGKVSIPPDYVIITLKLESQNTDYSQAVRMGAEQVEILRKAVEKAGFSVDNLKSIRFNVDTEYGTETYEDNGHTTHRSVIFGYKCRHTLQLSFDMDNERLSEVMSVIGGGESKAEISISFTVKNAESMREEILKLAVEDARQKAQIICKAANVELVDILRIENSWEPPTLDSCFSLNDVEPIPDYDFYPDDIEAKQSLDIIWEIR